MPNDALQNPTPPAAPPRPDALPGPYATSLSPIEEQQFQNWVKNNHIPSDNDPEFKSPENDYDMRGYWKAQQAGDPNAKQGKNRHFPDTYKTPYHHSFSKESKYATDAAPHWIGNKLVDPHGKVVWDDDKPSDNQTLPSWEPQPKKLDFSSVPGHASHGVSVGEVPVEPTPIPAGLQPSPEEQYLSHLTAQDEATKAAKDTLYQNSPEEFKKQHPVEYWVRKGHDAVQQSLVGHATAAVKPEIAAPVKSDISNVAELGTSLYGLPSGTDEPTIKQGIIPEGAPEELDFSGVAGHKKIAEAPAAPPIKPPIDEKPPVAVAPEPKSKILYHGTTDASSKNIEDSGLTQGMLTDSPELAQEHAERRVNQLGKGNPVVYKVHATPDQIENQGDIVGAISGKTHGTVYGLKQPIPKESITNAFPENEAADKNASVPDHPAKSIAESVGVTFRGKNSDGIVEMTLPRHLTENLPIADRFKDFVSITMPEKDMSAETVQAAVDRKMREMGGSPESGQPKSDAVEVEGGDPNLGANDTSFDFGANVPESKYHPDLQKVVDKYGETSDSYAMHNGASFITPEGQYVHGSSKTHDGMMLGAGASQDDKANFINDTGAIRTQARLDKGSRTLAISIPKDGVTPKQVDALKRGVRGAIGNYGNIVMERADIGANTKDALSSRREMGNADHIEQMLKDIDAHPGPKPWMEQAAEKAKAGRFSVHPGTGVVPTEGKIAEVLPEKRKTFPLTPTAENIQDFYKENKDLLDKHPELHVGGFKNELNISAVGKNAEKVAKKLDQKSIYDLGADKEINTGGRGKQKEFPNYSLAERLRDLQGLPAGNKKRFESLSPTVYDNLSPEARRYLKDNNRLQSEVMNAFHSGISTEILNQRILQNLEEKKTGATSVYMKARPYADFLYDSPFKIKPH